MKNNIKAGDKFTIDAHNFTSRHANLYRDCTTGKVYTAAASGVEADGDEPDVTFIDDAGDKVVTGWYQLTVEG